MGANDSNARQDEPDGQKGKIKLEKVIGFGTRLPVGIVKSLEPGERVQASKPHDYEWAQPQDWPDNYQNVE